MWYLALIIIASCVLGLGWAIMNALEVTKIDPKKLESSSKGTIDQIQKLEEIGGMIEKGAQAFLKEEYTVMCVFVLCFSVLVFFMVDWLGSESSGFRMYASLAYIVGSLTSMICGYIGMSIAVKANFRTAFKAIDSLEEAFVVAFRAGCVMGFSMISLSLAILITLLEVYKAIFKPVPDLNKPESYAYLMEYLAAYGLGGSSIALFGRVGGGIYTKAADVGADLVGKVEEGLDEDSPRNPATIADNVGDNVGDIAGMGSDLFGSFAESTCAALVFVASNPDLIKHGDGTALYFPMLLSAFGIIACIGSSVYGIYGYKVKEVEQIEKALNLQLTLSTLLILLTIPIAAVISLPFKWRVVYSGVPALEEHTNSIYAAISVALGLVSGLIIGYSTDYYTSNAHEPVIEMANACSSGPAINIIYGLALGYNSTIVPILLLAVTAVVSMTLCGLFGVALAAIGMLSNLCVGLAIDAYGPISDNAGGKTTSCRNRRNGRTGRRCQKKD